MKESKLVVDGRFRVFSDGSINKVLPGGEEVSANLSYASRDGKYAVVNYWEDGKQKKEYVHRLVAKVFLPNPDNLPIVNHKDGDTRNNSVDNLEWCSASYNIKHAYSTGLIDPYSLGRRCANCGKSIVNKNKSGLCGKCKAQVKAATIEQLRSYRVFWGVIDYHKRVTDMTNEDIAQATGYKKDTIDKFMCGQKVTKAVAYKICDLFSIDRELFSTENLK